MPKRAPKVVMPTNLLEFPAIKAWRELRPGMVQPGKIEILRGRKWMRHYMETMAYAMQVAGWAD